MADQDLLLISYLFPPAGGIPVQRALSLARYLPRHGYRVHVLTARNPAAPVVDSGLLKRVPPEVNVNHAFTPEISFELRQKLWRWLKTGKQTAASQPSAGRQASGTAALGKFVQRLLCPDPEVMWRPFALRAAASLIQQHDIKTILVTAPPFSLLTTGVMLKRRFPGVQLISDFRDSWLDFYLSTFDFLQSDSMRRRAMDLESEVVRESDMVVTVTSSTLREIRERYPNQPENKFACVPNGYDSEVFAKFRPRPHGTGKIVVTLMGTVYQANSARYYLDALDRLPVELAERFETRFVGRVTDQERAYLEQPRRSHVKQFGFLPQAKAIELLEETDYLLVTMTDPSSMPGKMYEYLATGKPVLAFSPANGELSRLLMDTGAGWCVDPDDREAACLMLRLASSRIEEGHSTLRADWNLIKQFDRERLTGTYARLMQGCLDRGSSGHL